MALHLQSDLLELDDDAILDYLHHLKRKHKTPSDSFFKHTVYGLRYLFRLYDKESSKVILPSIERPKKYPVVLSSQEVKALLKAPALLRHRLIIGLLYGCGLRNHELCKLKITDLNLERQMLHVREGKGRKDRYVPLCDMLVRGVKKYLASEHPVEHLFNGKSRTGDYVAMSARGVQWAIREARRLSGIKKQGDCPLSSPYLCHPPFGNGHRYRDAQRAPGPCTYRYNHGISSCSTFRKVISIQSACKAL
jgi:integrase/recombinase XerD